MVDTPFFDYRLYADDLSFSNTEKDAVILSGNVFSFTLSKAWPVEITLELFSAIRYNSIKDSIFYPSLYIDAPILQTEEFSIGLRGGALGIIRDLDFSSLFTSGASFFFALPFSVNQNEISIGAYFQKDGVYYNLYNSNFKPSFEKESIAFFLESNLNFNNYLLNINAFMNFEEGSMNLLAEDSYIDIALSFTLANISFSLGARKQNLFNYENFIASSDFYLSLGTRNGSMETNFQIRYRNGKSEIGFYSSLALFDVENDVYNKRKEESIFNLFFDLGFENYYTSGLYFIVSPILSFNISPSFSFSFRIPLYIENNDGSLHLVSLKADPWYDMFQKNENFKDVFNSITDIFALIDEIKFGEESSTFYLDAMRDRTKVDIFFENYKSFDALSLDLGLRFYNLSFGLYIDDLEVPRIFDPYIIFYPFGDKSASFSISIPTEVKMKDERNFDIHSFLGLTYNQPFLSGRLNFSFFLYGELYANYVDGSPVETGVIYDFNNNRLYGYLLGGEIRWKEDIYEIGINGGIHSGMVYPNYFNAFSSLNPDLSRTGYEIESLSGYLIFDASLSLRPIQFLLKYSMPNISSLSDNWQKYEGDMFTLDLRVMLQNGVGINFSISKNNFISSLPTIIDLYNYLNSENTIYAISMTKEFNSLSLLVELSTVAIYEESEYINSYKLKSTSPRLKVEARIGF